MSRRIGMVLEYDGTAYGGFQLQPNAPTVQGELERAAYAMTHESSRVHGAGRTDAGVHAMGQVAVFDTESSLPVVRFRPGLNHHLPDDISILDAYDVEADFDPRRHALSRVYRYTFLEAASRSPLRRRYVHLVDRALDIEAMAEALSHLIGERDFAAFSGGLPEGKTTIRRMDRADVWREEDEVHIELEASAFLPQQVRRTAAAALRVGLGKTTIASFESLADSTVRGAAEYVLPPTGLCLRQVKYREFPPESHAATTDHTAHQAR